MATPETYETIPLFGGAITANLPSGFIDVSELRQVPDHQEVRVARTGLASIVFDVLERVAPPGYAVPAGDDGAALALHFADVTAAGHARGDERPEETRVLRAGERVAVPRLGAREDVVALRTVALQVPAAGGSGDEGEVRFTGIALALVRLEAQGTDLLVAVNVPHGEGEDDARGGDLASGAMRRAVEWHDEILRTLRVEDWGLFGE